MPGSKGGWVTIKDAVKKPAHADAPHPAGLKTTGAAAAAEAPAAEGADE